MARCQFCRQCTCRVRDTEPMLYQWVPERPESPTLSMPSLSTCSSSSTASSPAPSFPPSLHSTKARHYESKSVKQHGYSKAHKVQGKHTPDSYHPTVDDSSVRQDATAKLRSRPSISAFEPEVRTHTLNGEFIRYPVTDENDKHNYYMQRMGSHPTQSLQSKPNVISSYRKTGPKLSSEPNEHTVITITNNRIMSFEIDPAHDPRDWIVEKTAQRTIRRDDNKAIEKPSPSLDSKNSTRTSEPPKPFGQFLHQFRMLALRAGKRS
ncbi:hypothetical protein F5050DRAFT_1191895 [Lentinula boryana]|uniref:Uncharacterized protein n=1 Tax=Lentinula boryana TaxID=40481 RepID=A0ABQ8QJA8_9AGAR|nr:hypothetical protein F5050DRAFT_1191895 [Lentinula boryana]